MCGRFTLRAPASVLGEYFSIFEVPPFAPRFNIAPTQPAPVVRLAPGHAAGGTGVSPVHGQDARGTPRELVWLRWGLIPSWAKDPAIGNRLINARAETAAEKPAYREAFRRRRCLIAADGFYEWKGKRKWPYFIHFNDDRPFAFAGLRESWEGPDHSYVESCTILTTGPNELMHPIHDRMPVILSRDAYEQWLDPTIETPDPLVALLVPHPADEMTADPVSTWVNKAVHDDARCIEPERDLFS